MIRKLLVLLGLIGLVCALSVSLDAQTAHSVTITEACNTSGGTVTTYNILRGTTSGGESTTPIGTVPAASCTGTPPVFSYVDSAGLVEGQTYFYEITATGPGGTSSPSSEVSATVPFSPPSTPAKPTISVK